MWWAIAVIQAVSFFGFFAALRCLFVGFDRVESLVPSYTADWARGFPLLSGITLAEQASHAVLSCLASHFQNCTPEKPSSGRRCGRCPGRAMRRASKE